MSNGRSCPCESGLMFSVCCEPIITGVSEAATAEALMRSRYVAFVRRDEPYLLKSWHADTRPSRVRFADDQQWIGLTIKSTESGGVNDSVGRVRFVARYKIAGKGFRIKEFSRFTRVDDCWQYIDGEHEE